MIGFFLVFGFRFGFNFILDSFDIRATFCLVFLVFFFRRIHYLSVVFRFIFALFHSDKYTITMHCSPSFVFVMCARENRFRFLCVSTVTATATPATATFFFFFFLFVFFNFFTLFRYKTSIYALETTSLWNVEKIVPTNRKRKNKK